MMKKLLAVITGLMMVFALVACSPKTQEPATNDQPGQQTETTQPQNDTTTQDAETEATQDTQPATDDGAIGAAADEDEVIANADAEAEADAEANDVF